MAEPDKIIAAQSEAGLPSEPDSKKESETHTKAPTSCLPGQHLTLRTQAASAEPGIKPD